MTAGREGASSSRFRAYKGEFVALTRDVLRERHAPAHDEAAFPAYANPNPLISHLFWQRIRTVMAHLGDARHEAVLDFGCGGGVMLPFLAERANRVVAMDLDLSPLEEVAALRALSPKVERREAAEHGWEAIPSGSFAIVLALDVLEHVDALDATITHLLRVLAPGGELIVSGPTENLLYRIGRRIAGPDYSGAYHVRGIASIRDALARRAEVRAVATLYPLLPLFRIYSVRHRPG